MKFVLIKRTPPNPSCKPYIEWWEITKDNTLFNDAGGWNTLCSTDEILETLELPSWKKLWTTQNKLKTSYYQELINDSTRKELKLGWLAPDGKMHYCQFFNHTDYVHEILNLDVPTIEKRGWIHIYRGLTHLHPNDGQRMTQEQARTAREELGLLVFDEDILY